MTIVKKFDKKGSTYAVQRIPVMYSKLLELEKEQSKLNRLVQSIVTSDPQAPNNFEVLMPCVLSGQLVIDNGRKFTLTSYRYQCSTAQLFLPKKDLKYIQNNFKELKKTPDKQDKIFETIYDEVMSV